MASEPLVIRSEAPTVAPVIRAEEPVLPPLVVRSELLAEETLQASQNTVESTTSSNKTKTAERLLPEQQGLEVVGGALAMLDEIPIKGRAPKTGYSRKNFGSGWKDPDGNGCDARNDILRRDLTSTVTKPGTHDCVVLSGILQDPYTGQRIEFTRGQGTSTAVHIDHVVALSDAWQKGAQKLDAETMVEFANDPLNLLAVDGKSNMSKGDSDAASWLPPQRSAWCSYVIRQVQVKHHYSLWMTKAEHSRIKDVLSARCS
ncbi:HNH endonuclease family protein [Arthrobacter sp. MYb227]|uniref:HNH endonuclease family protein n=1 Tax=Arthrobacter sp. MYb227 TaxID=1848601 RepID=UPI00280AC731|nr:HNH endonuclease family protein [Arthrobacter sp. MYb227]